MHKRISVLLATAASVLLIFALLFTAVQIGINDHTFINNEYTRLGLAKQMGMSNAELVNSCVQLIDYMQGDADSIDIYVTVNGEKTKYNPQFIKRDKPIKSGGNSIQARVYSGFKCMENGNEYKKTYDYKNPITLIEFDKVRKGALHPTQKPIALLEYLIRTYTNEGETVLDFTMGSGSTGVACVNTNRNFIGIELDENYFKIAKERIGV